MFHNIQHFFFVLGKKGLTDYTPELDKIKQIMKHK